MMVVQERRGAVIAKSLSWQEGIQSAQWGRLEVDGSRGSLHYGREDEYMSEIQVRKKELKGKMRQNFSF